jgi:hypothetical protein
MIHPASYEQTNRIDFTARGGAQILDVQWMGEKEKNLVVDTREIN